MRYHYRNLPYPNVRVEGMRDPDGGLLLATNREAPGVPREQIAYHSYRTPAYGDLLSPLLVRPLMVTEDKINLQTGGDSDSRHQSHYKKHSGVAKFILKKLRNVEIT